MFIALTRSSDGLPWHVAVSHIISYSQRFNGEGTVVQTIDADQVMIVKDRPEEIAALIEAEIRKQRRYEIAARFLSNIPIVVGKVGHLDIAQTIGIADALLDALEGGAA